MQRPDPVYMFHEVLRTEEPDYFAYYLNMTSQRWKDGKITTISNFVNLYKLVYIKIQNTAVACYIANALLKCHNRFL